MSSPMPALGGPPPPNFVFSRVDQLSNPALAGKACTFLDVVGLKIFAATVTSASKSQIVINSPNGGGALTFPLTPMDGALMLPIGIAA